MSERYIIHDQAEGLVKAVQPKNPRVICVGGGKGGVGKTSVSVNLAIALAKLKKRVLLFDGDLGLANVDVMLGLTVRHTLADVLSGSVNLKDILVEGPEGVRIIPTTSGQEIMTQLSNPEYAGVITAFHELSTLADYLIVDTAAGISKSVTSFLSASNEVVLVMCDEPTSITDTYALIKLMSRDYGVNRFHILVNMVRSNSESKNLFEKIRVVTDRFLDVQIELLGSIPQDEFMRKSICKQRAVMDLYPGAKSSIEFSRVAKKINEREFSNKVDDRTTFFIENIIANCT